MSEEKENKFNLFSPTDYRYFVEDLVPFLSEEAFIKYKLKVEVALVKVLARRGICSGEVVDEIKRAAESITCEEVYQEERRVKHDIRALVNVIKGRVSEKAKPFVHLCATSYDIVDTANALRYKDATLKVILPDMVKLEKIWMELALREKDTLQIGRTHGQHAEPVTFGFALSWYVHRWGNRILCLKEASSRLVGKFSGAVGAYNASSLLFDDPEEFEREVLSELGLEPAEISTQIVYPEPIVDFFHAVTSSFGVLANFCDDMRHLQRSEIAEVGEPFEEAQVGSSTMPQKRNPVNFENVKSMWKVFYPRMMTVYADQISEHQRDLTNSCSQRYLPELLVVFDSSIRRMIKISSRLQVDKANMQKNFKLSADKIIAEPLYILLSIAHHPDAHEYVRRKVSESLAKGKPLYSLVMEDEEVKKYLDRLSDGQREVILNPESYTGIAPLKTEKIVRLWEERLKKAGLCT
ncbi:adenylosuccinate lyase [Candidatus Aerophobetes bacterium]|nr:adenylosuccinate lyase [Candidatus Aerophobetes bacterium]